MTHAFWGFGYDPHALDISLVEQAACALATAIYQAAKSVDAFTVAVAV